MADDVNESMVRQWLRDHTGQAYCASCIAKALAEPSVPLVQTAIDDLAPRQIFSVGPCTCGASGLRYGW